MRDTVISTIEKYGMLRAGDRVAVGLSGGADSTALLHILCALRERLGIELRAVHINHCIRGAEADGDQRRCAELCDSLGVRLETFRVDVPKVAAETGKGLEEAGRDVRYLCFEQALEKWREEAPDGEEINYLVATAHTLSDSMETMLLNMTRGCGTGGLCGIPPVRAHIVRPLIGVTRAQVEEYCAANGLSFVTDSTNSDTEYSRNLIRAEVIPRLRKLNPSLEAAFSRLAEAASEDERCLRAASEVLLDEAHRDGVYRIEPLLRAETAVRRRALIGLAERECGMTLTAKQVALLEKYIESGGGAVELSERWTLRVDRNTVRASDAQPCPRKERPAWELLWQFEDSLTLPDGRRMSFIVINSRDFAADCEQYQKNCAFTIEKALDYDIIKCKSLETGCLVRSRREGDRFSQNRRNGSKSLKKLFNERHIPPVLRGDLALLVCGGEIAWIEGIGAAKGFAADEKTARLLFIRPEDPKK